MSDRNPYEAPRGAARGVEAGEGVARLGSLLVIRQGCGANLPDRCVRCNAPAEQRATLKFRHYSARGLVLALFCASLVLPLLLLYLMSPSMRIEIPLCASHLRRYRLLRYGGGLLLLTPVIGYLPIMALSVDLGDPVLDGLTFWAALLSFGLGGVAMVLASPLRPSFIGREHGLFAGCQSDFRQSLDALD